MSVFGKSLSEYVRFQRVILLLILAVGLARLVLSLAGLPDSTVKLLSVTVVGLAGVFYYGIRVPQTGFGGYKHLLPLLYIQAVVINGIAILGILLARFGLPNIYAANEYGGSLRARYHILGHAVIGTLIAPLVIWLLAALVMWVTKKVSPRPTAAAPA
jgi:hypothetical protein